MTTTSSSVVQYGRRKGLSRENTEELFEKAPIGELISKGMDLRQVTVLPKQEWERIQDNLNNPDKKLKCILAEIKEKKDLHLRSKAVVKNWTNTITGQRQKRLTAKKLREEREQEEKQRIDLEEAKYQAEKRREAIENAQLKQYYMTDRVKNFHSGLLLTQVMKEREAQIELKKKMELIYKKKEQKPEEGLLKERRTEHERFLARKAEYDDLLEQIEQHMYLKKLDKLEDKKEGEEIQRLTRLYEQEMQQKYEKNLEEKMEQMKAYHAYVADRDLLRAVEKQNIEEADEKIHLFVKAKQNLSKLRKEKEMEKQRKAEAHRKRISDFLCEQIKEKHENEDERIARAVAELEENIERENRQKEEKQNAAIKAIAEHREAMKQRKEKQEKEDKLQAVQNLQAIRAADMYFLEQQKEKMRKMKDECLERQTFLIQQMVDKRTKLRLAKEADREYERQNEAVKILEEKHFQEYAQDVINSAIRAGQNPYPLLWAARAGTGAGHGPVYLENGSIQPSYQSQDNGATELPTNNGTTTEEIKSISDTKDIHKAKKKIGFTWETN
ncbi:cilia- and flagella- associated protein 210 [Microcaecilia unicolor]|uniref:Coiled-coil domain-containing protein 173 n=1 Tax=Microcaecilia unicolor TaxID=1415580 RepID=A0A6P7YKP9_9AMPH|nr:coiled-coil domain-containing protein 173 [Microcaecilia unicolor]